MGDTILTKLFVRRYGCSKRMRHAPAGQMPAHIRRVESQGR
jgi:hypothetical protein